MAEKKRRKTAFEAMREENPHLTDEMVRAELRRWSDRRIDRPPAISRT